jgi:hypothetical protein
MAERKRGRPALELTPTTLSEIERLAGRGFRLEDIAIACDVSKSTLKRWLKHPEVQACYQKGRIEATSNVAYRLYELCMAGEVAACIFWLKAQAGWTDKPQPELEQQPEQVHIYLPENHR